MFVAVALGNGATSGIKHERNLVEEWARNQLNNTKATNIFIFEAVAEFCVAPRMIIEKELKPTEKNTRPETETDPKCEACEPKPSTMGLRNGKDRFPASDDPDVYAD